MRRLLCLLAFCFGVMANCLQTTNPRTNLTKITWKHAVNSQKLLVEALESDTDMIEADIGLGTVGDDPEIIPIMAHPPNNQSDLSLREFLSKIDSFNANASKQKGVKLDFKSLDAFLESVELVKPIDANKTYQIWVNADILVGPVNATGTPVDANRFLNACKDFKRAVLSVGWTTKFTINDIHEGYTQKHVEEMLETLKNNSVNQIVTYPVRACYVANSKETMQQLLSYATTSTLTIWQSSLTDVLDIEKLRRVILDIGVDKIYLDVPKSIEDKLHLDQN